MLDFFFAFLVGLLDKPQSQNAPAGPEKMMVEIGRTPEYAILETVDGREQWRCKLPGTPTTPPPAQGAGVIDASYKVSADDDIEGTPCERIPATERFNVVVIEAIMTMATEDGPRVVVVLSNVTGGPGHYLCPVQPERLAAVRSIAVNGGLMLMGAEGRAQCKAG